MSRPHRNHSSINDDELIRRVIDQLVTSEEHAAFNQRLLTDAAFRQRYVYLVDLEADLYDEFSGQKPAETYVPPQQSGWPAMGWMWACLAAALVANLAWIAWGIRSQTQQKIVESTVLDPTSPTTESRRSTFVPIVNSGGRIEHAAVVVRINSEPDLDLHVGQRLQSGVLKFASGEVQLEFISGAILAIAGPAELNIHSKDAATLVAGMVSTRVPPRARGFVLNAPDAAIVDLGTEFGVRIDESGNSEVGVTSGEVHLSLIGEDGNTLLSQLVSESENVRVDSREQQLVRMEHSGTPLPQISPSDDTPLPVTDSYISAVHQLQPIVYWRFESESGGVVSNTVDDNWAASIYRAESDAECIRIVNGCVRFDYADEPRYLITEQAMPGVNSGPYSIEFWMKPDDLHRCTCVGLFPDSSAYIHLNVVEIATDTELVHAPGAIRFLHRNPPSKSISRGTNIFSDGVCIPGQWQHVVAVKDGATLQLYFNGRLTRQVSTKDPDSNDEFRMVVGQLNLFDTERQFVGCMDEVALYRQALTPSDIEQHYKLIAGDVGN